MGDVLVTRGNASRSAHRTILEPHLGPLGKAIHEIAAGVVIEHRGLREGTPPGGEASLNAARAAGELKALRLVVKYSLPGASEALRVLSRGPDWIAVINGDPSGDELVEEVSGLGRLLDAMIGRSYRRSRPPVLFKRWLLRRRVQRVRRAWKYRFKPKDASGPEDDRAG